MPEVIIETPRGPRLAGTYRPADPADATSGTPSALLAPGTPSPWRAPDGVAVLFAHGFLADRSSRGRADDLAERYAAHGLASLRFDFSGCGASDDDVVEVGREVEDLLAASAHLAALGHARQVVHAHSLGALVALRACPPAVEAMVLTGAVTSPIRHPWHEVLDEDQLAELDATGRTRVVEDGASAREHNVISRRTLEEFAGVDQEALLAGVTCPVLLVHGGALVDGEEHPLLTRSRVGLPWLPDGSALVVVPGGEHHLLEHTDAVARRVMDWLAATLAGPSA